MHGSSPRRVIGAVALTLSLMLGAGLRSEPEACDAEVVVVLSGRSDAIVQAGEGVVAGVPGDASVMTLEEFTRDCQIDPGRTYVGVGPSATVYLTESAPAGATIGACLVPDLRSITPGERVSLVGVHTTVDVRDQLDLLREAVPSARTIGVLHRSGSPVSRDWIGRLREDPDTPSVVLIDLDEAASVSEAIAELMDEDVDAVWTFPDPAVYDAASVRLLLISSLREKVPVFGFSDGFVRAGALVGVQVDPASQGEQLGALLQRPREEGVTLEPCRLEYALNLVVADRLGLRVPKDVREAASVVFD